MRIFKVTFTYTKDNSTKTENIEINANGVGKALEVAQRSFNKKHKKDIDLISDIGYEINQVIKENDEI